MKRIIAVALIAGASLIGVASAQERTATSGVSRSTTPVTAVQQIGRASLVSARRCSGAACLQNVPSLGVAF